MNKQQKILFVLCFAAYMLTYVARLNFSSVTPTLEAAGVLSKNRIAAVGSAFFITYGIGQLFGGYLSDKFNPIVLMTIGLCGAGITNVLIGFFDNYGAMTALWALNGLSQVLIWPPIIKICSSYYADKTRDSFAYNISATVPLGTLSAYFISLLIIKYLPYNYVFFIAGAIVLSTAVAVFVFGKIAIANLSAVELTQNDDAVCPPQKPVGKQSFTRLMISSGILFLLFPTAVHGTLKDSLSQWVPVILTDNFHVRNSFSLLLTMFLPVVNLTGAYIGKFVNKYTKNEAKTVAVFFATASVAVLLLYFFKNVNIYLTLILLSVCTTSMFAINVMLITVVPIYFSDCGKSGFISGFLNAVAYIGCATANYVVGARVEIHGWIFAFAFWFALSVIGIIFSLSGAKRWNDYKNR